MTDFSKYQTKTQIPEATSTDFSKYGAVSQEAIAPKGNLSDNIWSKLAGGLDTVFGGGKVGEAIGTKVGYALAKPEEKQFFDTSTPSTGQIAGSALQSASLFTPVGTIAKGITGGARALGMVKGASALGKIGAGLAGGEAFDVASNLQEGKTGTEALTPGVGTAIGGGLPLAGAALKVGVQVANKAVPTLLSYTSEVPEKAFETMLQRRQPVVEAIKKGATPITALKNTQDAVRGLRKTLTNDWQEGLTAIQQEFSGKRMGLSDKSVSTLTNLADEFGFDDVLPQNLKSASVNEWVDVLKRINELPKAMLTFSPKGAKLRSIQANLKDSVVKNFGGEGGSVSQLYKNYSAKKSVFDAANDIVKAYSTGKPITQTTSLNRLQTLFNENKPAYLDAILDLEKVTGRDLMSEITASKFANKLPTMGTSVSATSGILAPTGVIDKAIKLLLLPLSSPRSAGFIARTLNTGGKTSSVLQKLSPSGKSIFPGDTVLEKTGKAKNVEQGIADYIKNPKAGMSIKDVSGDLYNEAKKYKSAEDFVKAQGNPILHGTPKQFQNFDVLKRGTYEKDWQSKNAFFFTDSLDTAKSYGKNIKQMYSKFSKPLEIDAEGLSYGDFREEVRSAVEKAKNNGNDVVIFKNLSDRKDWGNYEPATHYAVLDITKLKTKSQLTDIWNKANKK